MATDTSNLGPIAHNTKHLCRLDMPGGGQVTADGDTLYIAHMAPPFGTSIYDISDPRKPRLVGKVELENDIHTVDLVQKPHTIAVPMPGRAMSWR